MRPLLSKNSLVSLKAMNLSGTQSPDLGNGKASTSPLFELHLGGGGAHGKEQKTGLCSVLTNAEPRISPADRDQATAPCFPSSRTQGCPLLE